jgi:hypothetical protein
MKKLLLLLAAIFILISCKKEENPQPVYPAMEVASKEGNAFKILNDSVLKVEWEKELPDAHAKIRGFEVEEVKVKGANATVTVIVAYCKDGKTTVGALLTEKGGYYYFEPDAAMVMCSGCVGGCKPEPVDKGGNIKLMCSTCDKCVKTDFSAFSLTK